MTAKEYLSQLKWLDKEIDEKQMELAYLRSRAENCSAPEMSDMPKGSGRKQQLDDVIIKIVDLQNYINVRIDTLIDLREKIIRQLDGIRDGRSRTILWRRYVLYEKWEHIERSLHYERTYLARLHMKALKEFTRLHPEIKKQQKTTFTCGKMLSGK